MERNGLPTTRPLKITPTATGAFSFAPRPGRYQPNSILLLVSGLGWRGGRAREPGLSPAERDFGPGRCLPASIGSPLVPREVPAGKSLARLCDNGRPPEA